MIRRRSSSAAAASERASASVWPVHHDGGDTPDAVEEACLQPRQRKELVARRCRGTDSGGGHRGRYQQPTHHQHERGQRVDNKRRDRHQQRPADRQLGSRQPARVKAIQRLDAIHHGSGQFTGMFAAKPREADMQQARQRIGPQPPTRRRPGVEGGTLGDERQCRAHQGKQPEAHQRRQRIADMAGQGTGKHGGGTPGLTHGSGGAKYPKQHHRPGCPAARALLAAQPGARCCLALLRLHPGARLAQTACAGQGGRLNCRQCTGLQGRLHLLSALELAKKLS